MFVKFNSPIILWFVSTVLYIMVRLFLSLTLIFIVTPSIRTSNGFTTHNSLLTGHVSKTFFSIDWPQCLQECHKQDICHSYNFFPPRKICELNNFGSKNRCKADNNLIKSAGWIHHVLDTSQVKSVIINANMSSYCMLVSNKLLYTPDCSCISHKIFVKRIQGRRSFCFCYGSCDSSATAKNNSIYQGHVIPVTQDSSVYQHLKRSRIVAV